MGYQPESIPTIMQRTKTNLKFIQQAREDRKRAGVSVDDDGPFEVTQLINSFMGAFAHPFEALFKLQAQSEVIQKDIEILDEILVKSSWHLDASFSLESALGCVRNAFAHGNIEFIPGMVEEPGGRIRRDIVEIRIWNCRPYGRRIDGWQQQQKTWEKTLTVAELEGLLLTFLDVMTRVDSSLFERGPDCSKSRQLER